MEQNYKLQGRRRGREEKPLAGFLVSGFDGLVASGFLTGASYHMTFKSMKQYNITKY